MRVPDPRAREEEGVAQAPPLAGVRRRREPGFPKDPEPNVAEDIVGVEPFTCHVAGEEVVAHGVIVGHECPAYASEDEGGGESRPRTTPAACGTKPIRA